MKHGFMQALKQAVATGQMPDPSQPAANPLREQLEASLAAAQQPVQLTQGQAVRTVPTAPAAGAPRPVTQGRRTTPPRRGVSGGGAAAQQQQQQQPASRRVGTIDEVLGLDGAVLPQPARGGDSRSDSQTLASPPMDRCSLCEGSGILQVQATGKRVLCGKCGGAGQVARKDTTAKERFLDSLRRESLAPTGTEMLGMLGRSTEAAVEAALAREVDVPLPLVAEEFAEPATDHEVLDWVEHFDDSAEGPIRFPGSIAESNQGPDARYRPWMDRCLVLAAEAAAEDNGSLPAEARLPASGTPAAPLTYDLPTTCDEFPLYAYVAGPAGTGKTWWAKALVASDPAAMVLAATTGIAAVNLGEGTTINALLKYYDLASLRDAFTGGWLEGQFKRLRRIGLKRIIIDEVSMLDGDQLTILCRALDNVNQDRVTGQTDPANDDPEMGLILVGDFAQLSPVPGKNDQGKNRPVIFAFESPEWERFAKGTYKLQTIRRQADRAFIEGLLAVRRGDPVAALEVFGPILQQTTEEHFPGTTILAKNDAVEKFNQLRLDKVPGERVQWQSRRWGKLRSEWGGAPKPPSDWQIPDLLKMKIGASVMILANKNDAAIGEMPQYRYVNGDQGTIEQVPTAGGNAWVKLARTQQVVQVEMLTRYNEIPLEVGRTKALRAAGTPELISADGKKEIIGWVHYMPMRLAYASTVYKSQGLSLDKVQVNIRDHFFSHPGMLYVALSRARTLAGLRLVGSKEAFAARCTVDPKVVPWL